MVPVVSIRRARTGPRVPHNRVTCGSREALAVAAVAEDGHWDCGVGVARFELALARCAQVDHAVCVGSGLGALRLALLASGVSARDEVIVPAYSCVALANAVLSLGAVPIAADVLPGEWNIDVADAKRKISRRTKALVAVHTFGFPARIRELKRLGVVVVEDCAHGLGRLPDGSVLGSQGDVAISSFYATKLIGAGEGGAVFASDAALADKVRRWRDYSDQPACATRLNDKMTDLSAALGSCQLDRLPALLRAREVRARRYMHAFARHAAAGRLELPLAPKGRIWYRYVLRAPGITAEEFCAALSARQIAAAEPVCDWRDARACSHPHAARAYRDLVSLPLYPTLTRSEQARVVCAVTGILDRRGAGR